MFPQQESPVFPLEKLWWKALPKRRSTVRKALSHLQFSPLLPALPDFEMSVKARLLLLTQRKQRLLFLSLSCFLLPAQNFPFPEETSVFFSHDSLPHIRFESLLLLSALLFQNPQSPFSRCLQSIVSPD